MSTRFFDPSERLPAFDENAFNEHELEIMIDMVRESSFSDDFTGVSIEDRLTGLFGGEPPEWVGFQSLDGTCYVNCYGREAGENQDDIDLQFELSDDLNEFLLTAMRINGEQQDEMVITTFEGQFR